MKIVMLYRQRSDRARQVEEYSKDFSRRHPDIKLNLVDIDTREGASVASLYDVIDYPAILTLDNSGQLLKLWQGEQLPLMDELAYYANQ